MSTEQSAASHASMVPAYHYVAIPFLFVATLYFGYVAATNVSLGTFMMLLLAAGASVAGLYARMFALGVQDRVIRLEERLRLSEVLPEELRPRIGEISTDHLIGLRFASDDQVEALVREILDGKYEGRKAVKAAVRTWRPDHQRI